MLPDLIYDIGMNTGEDTAFYLHKGFRVLAVEANPLLVALATQRFKDHIASNRLTILSCGISPTAGAEGTAPFYVCENESEWSSFDLHTARQLGPFRTIEVPCLPFAEILRQHGTPFYLKIDIEGADQLCIRDLPAHDPPPYVSAEFQDLAVLLALRDRGYRGFKCILQNDLTQLTYDPKIPPQTHPSPWQWVNTPDGKKGSWRRPPGPDGWAFPFGSSGPFAEQTPGSWQSFEQTAFTFMAHSLGHTAPPGPRPNRWLDVHATLNPGPQIVPPAPSPAEKFRDLLASLSRQHHRPARVWLFGAGKHTERLLIQSPLWSPFGTILGLIDDNPAFAPPNNSRWNLPILNRHSFEATLDQTSPRPDALILSSDTFEEAFWTLTAPLRARSLSVLKLYT